MNDQIKARGWLWDRSEKPTQWIALKCMECGETMTYPVIMPARAYTHCGRALKTYGYVRKAREIKG